MSSSYFLQWFKENQHLYAKTIKISQIQNKISQFENQDKSKFQLIQPHQDHHKISQDSQSTQKHKRISKKAKKITKNKPKSKKQRKTSDQDSDFDDPSFNVKAQKEDRNVLSNLAHHLFKYLNCNEQIKTIIYKIIKINSLTITISQFYELFNKRNKNSKSYVTEKQLRSLWFGQALSSNAQQEGPARNDIKMVQFHQIMRIISIRFYRLECFPSIFQSNKLPHQSKKTHYKYTHQIIKILLENKNHISKGQRNIKKESINKKDKKK